jgi:hypothetical protein
VAGPPGVLPVGPGALLEGNLLSRLGKLHLGERELSLSGFLRNQGSTVCDSGVEEDCLRWCLCVVDEDKAQPDGIEAPSPLWKVERLDLSSSVDQLCWVREGAHQTTGDTQEHSGVTKQPG